MNKILELYNKEILHCLRYRECHEITTYISKIIEAKDPLVIVLLKQEFNGDDRNAYLMYFNQEEKLKMCKFKVPTEPEKYRRDKSYTNRSGERVELLETDSEYYSRCLNQANYYVKKTFVTYSGYSFNQALITRSLNRLINTKGAKTYERFKAIHEENIRHYEVMQSFVSSVRVMQFGRELGNHNTNTFDWIKVSAELLYRERSKEEQKEYLKQNIHILEDKILEVLDRSATFNKFGIPLHCLEVSNIVYRNDNVLEYTFSLKKELRQLFKEEAV